MLRTKFLMSLVILTGLAFSLYHFADREALAQKTKVAAPEEKAKIVPLQLEEDKSLTNGPKEGNHYKKLGKEVEENKLVQEFRATVSDPQTVQVVEFFSYACQWCHDVDPLIEKWHSGKENSIAFYQVPVEFQPGWGPLSRAFYTMKQLEVEHKIHRALFEAINDDEITDSNQETLKKFFSDKGVKDALFTQAFQSSTVNAKQKWANAITKAYQIQAIPAVIIQGPHGVYLTTVRMAGGPEALLSVMDSLIEKQKAPLVQVEL